MNNMNDLPDNDPTRSDWWPTFPYGEYPLKDDIAQAQRQILMAHIANESKARELEIERRIKWEREQVTASMKLYELVASIASKVEVGHETIQKAKPLGNSKLPTHKRVDRGMDLNPVLTIEVNEEEDKTLQVATASYDEENPKMLLKTRGRRDGSGSAPAKSKRWLDYVIKKVSTSDLLDEEGRDSLTIKLEQLSEDARVFVFASYGKWFLDRVETREGWVGPDGKKRYKRVRKSLEGQGGEDESEDEDRTLVEDESIVKKRRKGLPRVSYDEEEASSGRNDQFGGEDDEGSVGNADTYGKHGGRESVVVLSDQDRNNDSDYD